VASSFRFPAAGRREKTTPTKILGWRGHFGRRAGSPPGAFSLDICDSDSYYPLCAFFVNLTAEPSYFPEALQPDGTKIHDVSRSSPSAAPPQAERDESSGPLHRSATVQTAVLGMNVCAHYRRTQDGVDR
jgi:hypothetical protein